MFCPVCGWDGKFDDWVTTDLGEVQSYECSNPDCGKWFYSDPYPFKRVKVSDVFLNELLSGEPTYRMDGKDVSWKIQYTKHQYLLWNKDDEVDKPSVKFQMNCAGFYELCDFLGIDIN